MEDHNQLSKEERLSVLAVLNDFAETFKQEAKARLQLSEKINKALESKSAAESDTVEFSAFKQEITSLLDLQIIKLENIFSYLQRNNLTVGEVSELRREIAELKITLRAPPSTTVIHHHHVHKIIIATIGLVLISLLLGYRLLSISDKLEDFMASDTKYRYMKLDMSGKEPGKYLNYLDSLCRANPGMRDSVLKFERVRHEKMERLQEAEELRERAKALEKNNN
jgi:hypothetical protein